MAHWQDRPEARWKEFRFDQPYARGLRRLKEEVLGKTDFDPATLWTTTRPSTAGCSATSCRGCSTPPASTPRGSAFEVRFDTTIPSGAATCHFTPWKPTPGEKGAWEERTRRLEAKALAHAKKPRIPERG